MALFLDGSGQTQAQAQAGGSALVKDSDTDTFMADVIEASQQVPVIVDFWAPWCGPCKTLGPLLEKLVRQSGGKVRMVKINVDENQELAAQFRIQSIPAVYAFKGGRPVDGFMGALPEGQLKSFIDRLVGGGANVVEAALDEAKTLFDEGQVDEAYQLYQEVLRQDQGNPQAIAGFLRCTIALGQPEQAEAILAKLPPDILKHPEIQAVKASLELAEEAGGASAEMTELLAHLEHHPNDHQARYDLAMASYAAGHKEQAVDALLEIIRRDRTWNDDQARKQLLKFFEAFGFADPVAKDGRRKLSTVLFS